jgi:nucleotide-binding universal stress UspA family protein
LEHFKQEIPNATENAASLARRYGSTIYLAHVITPGGFPLVSPEYAASSLQKMHAEAQQGFREHLKSGELIELPYKVLIQEGNLWLSIEELIKTYDIDLLVVGPRMRDTSQIPRLCFAVERRLRRTVCRKCVR